jgi:hypothetical protein
MKSRVSRARSRLSELLGMDADSVRSPAVISD